MSAAPTPPDRTPPTAGRDVAPPPATGSGGHLIAVERVLPTLNPDGSRRWIRPRPSPGAHWRRRRTVAWVLMAVYCVLPFLRLHGRPLVLLDLPRREFTLLGTTFLPTETMLFQLLFMAALLVIFLFTALYGRVWCGWACPQTVYMEFLFRPLERWIEGGWRGSQAYDRARRPRARRWLKHAVYLVIAALLAHVFLAYFVPVDRLAQWLTRSPREHPVSFFITLGMTALVFLDFAWFREQTCLVACPYGRLQSVLLDRRSLIVAYDPGRGEPRGRGVKGRAPTAGDCIDCGLCVLTCPTGIDIRDGLQMECIHCTQCADACDAVMTKIGRPRGLIAYRSQAGLAGMPGRMLRPRVVVYAVGLAATLALFGIALAMRADVEITLLRGAGAPYTLEPDGHVVNQVRVKVMNHGAARALHVGLAGAPGVLLIAPIDPLPVAAGGNTETSVFVVAPRAAFEHGEHAVTLTVGEPGRTPRAFTWRLVGPEPHDDERHEGAGGHR
jgi:cytochrome c oxidase accessory protein FixG